jgi:NADPH2:quinone reductase
MPIAIRLNHNGAPTVLNIEQIDAPPPGPGEVRLDQEAIGVNYLDVTQRNGSVKIPLPSGLGLEGAGRVVEIGSAVSHVQLGDRVAYALGPIGSYASSRLYPADRLIRIPDTMDFAEAASLFFKGLTAQYLVKSTFPVTVGTTILLYGAAGPVGQIIASWAKHLGATVIGVVSRATSIERALSAGCDTVLVWGKDKIVEEVCAITDGRMVDVVYDGIGRITFETSLDSLRTRGMMVAIGASSGAPHPVSVSSLNKKSLFLTRPGLAAHIAETAEYQDRARDLLDVVARGIVKPTVGQRFALEQAAQAHAVLEHGHAGGAIVLIP